MKVFNNFIPPWNQLRLFKLRNKLRGRVDISRDDDGYQWFTCKNCRLYLSLRDVVFMLLILTIGIATNISVDFPFAVKKEIIQYYHVTEIQLSYLNSLSSLSSIILNGFAGFLIDRVFGVTLSTAIYSLVGIMGAALFCIGGIKGFFWLMLTGRLIFWLGKELVTWVCLNYCMFHWYRNKIMNLIGCLFTDGAVMGSIILYSLCSTLLNRLHRSYTERLSLDIVLCLGCSVFVVTAGLSILVTYLRVKDEEEEEGNRTELPIQICKKTNQIQLARLRDLLSLGLVFWLLSIVNALHCALRTFPHFSLELLTSKRFDLSEEQAVNGMLAMSVVKVALSLPLSLSVDLLGRNSWYIILAQALSTLSYFFLSIRADPFAGMILVGLSRAIYDSAILPMFGYSAESHLIGSCYGIASMFGGMGTLMALFVLRLLIEKHGYNAVISFYLITSILSLVCMVVLWILDKRCVGVLSMTPKQRLQFEYRMNKGVTIKSMGTSLSFTSPNSSPFNTLDSSYSISRSIRPNKTSVQNTTQSRTQNKRTNI